MALVRIPSTVTRWPEYAQLFDDHINSKVRPVDDYARGVYTQAAFQEVEKYVGPLLEDEFDLLLDAFPSERLIRIPAYKVAAVDSITVHHANGQAITWAEPGNWQADTASNPGRVALAPGAEWPSYPLRAMNGVAVRIRAGWPDWASIPGPLKAAVLALFTFGYENRQEIALEDHYEGLGKVAFHRDPKVSKDIVTRGVNSLIHGYRVW